jgi:HEAT repeat protein
MSLRTEVEKFEVWASTYPEERSGEWECDYSEWDELHAAALSFISSLPAEEWSPENVRDLLYAIARDNEIEYLAEEVAKDVDVLLRLSELALSSSEVDAKWQLAVQLGSLSDRRQEAEPLLLRFVDDPDEYVSRRALLSLGLLKSARAEDLAERAWRTGHEYQRIAALWVLKNVASVRLADYIQQAMEDGRQYVVENAVDVQKT